MEKKVKKLYEEINSNNEKEIRRKLAKYKINEEEKKDKKSLL